MASQFLSHHCDSVTNLDSKPALLTKKYATTINLSCLSSEGAKKGAEDNKGNKRIITEGKAQKELKD